MERFGLRDDQWERIRDWLRGREGHVGATAKDIRKRIEAANGWLKPVALMGRHAIAAWRGSAGCLLSAPPPTILSVCPNCWRQDDAVQSELK